MFRSVSRPLRVLALSGCARRPSSTLPRVSVAILNVGPELGRTTRQLQTSALRRQVETAKLPVEPTEPPSDEIYYGPLSQTWRRLKIFSVSSLTLSTIMTPFMFLIETTSAVPLVARIALAGTVLTTSGISTAVVAWCSRPYVNKLHYFHVEDTSAVTPSQAAGKVLSGMELITTSLTLRKRITRVYDTAFIVPTSRPFSKWELAEAFQLPPAEAAAEKAKGNLPREETIAETLDEKGSVLGRWIVKWDADGSGTCRQVGKIQRCV
jgi:hypothetical protein